MSLQIALVGSNVTQSGIRVIGDGTNTTVRFDLAKWPVGNPASGSGYDFDDGVLPSDVIVEFESGPAGYSPTVTAFLDGSLLTVNFSPAPPAPAGSSFAQKQAAAVNIAFQLLYNGV